MRGPNLANAGEATSRHLRSRFRQLRKRDRPHARTAHPFGASEVGARPGSRAFCSRSQRTVDLEEHWDRDSEQDGGDDESYAFSS